MPPIETALRRLRRGVYTATVVLVTCGWHLSSLRGATLTNTNTPNGATWDTSVSGWSTNSGLSTPWDSANGPTNIALIKGGSGSLTVSSSGVWLGGLTFTNSSAKFSLYGSGTMTFGSAAPQITVTNTCILTNYAPIAVASGTQTLTKAGAGSLVLNGSSNAFSSLLVVSNGALVLTNGCWMGASSLSVGPSNNAPYIMAYGSTLGTVTIPVSPSASAANLFLSNSTILGQLFLATTTNGLPVYQYGGNRAAGYAQISGGTQITNAIVNGRLDINGGSGMTISGLNGTTNSAFATNATNAPGGINGTGLIAVYSTNAVTNGSGGQGLVLSFVPGATFAQLFKGAGSFATLVQSGTGTVSFGVWGYNSTNTASNTCYTFAGGSWNLGQLGQNNPGAMDGGTNVIVGDASVSVLANAQYSHAVWIVGPGSLRFASGLAEFGPDNVPLQITVNGGGTLSVSGDYYSGNYDLGYLNNGTNPAGSVHRLNLTGGAVIVPGTFGLGRNFGYNLSITNDVNVASIGSGTLSASDLCIGYSGTGKILNQSNSLTLSGGKLLLSGTVSVGTNSGQKDSFAWTGGQLTFGTLNAVGTNWGGSGGSISNSTLYATSGMLAPGDLGKAGASTISGNFSLSGNGTLALDLGGTNPATSFQTTNSGTSDSLIVSGSTLLGGTLSVSLLPGYTPKFSDTLTVLVSSNGITGNFTNAPVGGSVSPDGTNGFVLSLSGNALLLSQYHLLGAPSVTLQPSTPGVSLGQTVQISVSATSPIPVTYQWWFNSNALSGATNSSLILTNVTSEQTGTYYAVVSNADGSTRSASNPLTIITNTTVIQQPASALVNPGGATTLSVTANSSLSLSYQWQFNGADIPGATNASLSLSGAQSSQSGSYQVLMSSTEGTLGSLPVQVLVITNGALSLTNTNNYTVWSDSRDGWSDSPVDSPWNALNGRFCTAVITNTSAYISVDPAGVTLNSLQVTGSRPIVIGGGPVNLSGDSGSFQIPVASSGIILSSSLNSLGAGTFSVSGSGSLVLNAGGNFSGTLKVGGGADLVVAQTSVFGSATVSVSDAGSAFNCFGTVGSILVNGNGNSTWASSSGSAGSINLTASNATFLGAVVIAGPDSATKFAYVAPNMPNGGGSNYGYAAFYDGVSATNVTVNGRLDLLGSSPMSISGISGNSNGQTNWAGGGSGAIVSGNTYAASNSSGGSGNVYSFTAGSAFSGFYLAKSTYATLTQSGTGTTSFGIFGQLNGNNTPLPTNNITTISGGNWVFGQLGQNNGSQMAYGTFNLRNGANVTVGGNTGAGGVGMTHGFWNISSGSMTFLGSVGQGGGGDGYNNQAWDTLQFTVGTNGRLASTGNFQLGVNAACVVTNPSSITVNGGTVNISGALSMGNAANASNAVSNDVIAVTVNSGTLSVSNGITVGYNSTNGLVINEQALLTLAGGKLLSAGTLNAETALSSNSTITSSFVWSGGQLSASSVTASNSCWNGSNSSIRNNTVYNSNGVLSPGDFGMGGKTTITGNYVQGSNAVLDIDLGGSSPATGFQSGTNTYDTVSVTGSATVAGTVRVRLAPGFVPTANQTFPILSASGGLTSNLSTNVVVSSDGMAQFSLTASGGSLQLTSYTPLYPPVITVPPASTNVLIGNSTTLSVTATSSIVPFAYQWSWNGTNISGATNPTLTLTNVGPSSTGSYAVLVTNAQGSNWSPVALVGLTYPAPVILSQPASVSLSSGSPLTLSANAVSTDPNTAWQWLFNGVPLAGATAPVLSIPRVQLGDAGSYSLRISNSGGSVTSAPATVGVNLTPPSFTNPLQPVTCAIGENPVFTAGVDSFGTNVTYQWTRNGTNIVGATNSSLTLTNAQLTDNGTSIGLVVSNSAGSTTNLPVALTVTVFSPQVLGLKQISYDYQGGQTLSAAPAPGVHPRIYFNAEDLPAIRARLTNTAVGIEAFRMCQIYTTFLRSGSSAYYAGTNNWSLTMPDGNSRIGNTGFCDKSAIYNELIAGKTATLANWITTDPNGPIGLSVLSGEMTMEAFECLVKAGQAGIDTRSSNLAKAMDTWATYVLSDPAYPGYPVGRAWEFGQHQMALTYDLAYNFLNKDQRDHVRKALALMMTCLFNHSSAGPNSPINGVGYKGVGQAPESVTSNHVAIDTYKLMVACALEGEISLADAGFDAVFLSQWFAKAMGAMHDFLTYGFYDDGGQWEGQGKNYLYAEHLIPLARRGYNFFAHPHVQAYMRRWLPAVIQPYGYSFTSFDLLGGSGYNAEKGRQFIHGGDFLGLKWMFPNDPAADLDYRNYVLTEYKDAGTGQWKTYIDCTLNKFDFHSSYYHGLIPLLAFPSDVANTNSLKQQFTDILGSLDYIEPTGGSLVSRSSFDTNAMSTVVHMRQDFGGHTFSDRNAFSITALGRLFLRFSSGSSSSGVQNGAYQNIIDIDGLEMYITPEEGDKMRIPEKVSAWTPTNGPAMFITGDTTYAYSWQWIWNNYPTGGTVPLNSGYQADMNCFNNFRRSGNKDPLDYGNIPFVAFPQWDTPNVNEGVQSAPYNPMLQVMRTVGLVRGTNPYMLEIDDLQKDQSPHDYLWHTCVSDDLTLLVGTNLPAGCNAATDIVLREPTATGNRSLLVRFLSEDPNGTRVSPGTNVLGQFTNGVGAVMQHVGFSTNYLAGDTNLLFQVAGGNDLGHLEFQTNMSSKDKWTRLVHELSNSVAPGFKILFYPFTNGASIPGTQWGAVTNAGVTNTTLTVTIGSQADTFTFFPRTTLAGGSNVTVTEFTLTRGGSNLVDYRNQIQPCNVRDPSGTLDTPQSAPAGISASVPSGNRVSLTWSNSTNASSLLLERSLSGSSNWIPLSPVLSPGTTSYTDTNVSTSLAYDYRLAAVGASGVSAFATVSATTTQPAPTTLTATPGSGQIALTWSAVPTAASYSLMRSTVSGGPYTAIASGLTATSFTDTAVTRGVTYFYYVTADGSTGQGVPSAEVSAAPFTLLQAWRQQVFGTILNSGSAADTANPSGDGIPNLMKYALGLSPLSTNAAAKPLAVLTNGCLQISFTRTNDPTLLYTVEGTSDFSSWTPVWSSTGSSNTNGPVTVRDTNSPVSSAIRRFLRLRVTAP